MPTFRDVQAKVDYSTSGRWVVAAAAALETRDTEEAARCLAEAWAKQGTWATVAKVVAIYQPSARAVEVT